MPDPRLLLNEPKLAVGGLEQAVEEQLAQQYGGSAAARVAYRYAKV